MLALKATSTSLPAGPGNPIAPGVPVAPGAPGAPAGPAGPGEPACGPASQRTSLSALSPTYRLPAVSTATPTGVRSWALVAAPPSPHRGAVAHGVPLPAMRLIVPAGDTLRTSSSPPSAMYTFSAASTATAVGTLSFAAVAATPSPQAGAVVHCVPSPATR